MPRPDRPSAGTGPGQNLRSSLKRSGRRAEPMTAYDRLPEELRSWLAQAALPWSTRSALRLWHRALRSCNGDAEAARQELSRIERANLRKDAARIWGTSDLVSGA